MNVNPQKGSATDKATAFLIVVISLLMVGVVVGIIPLDNVAALIRLMKE